MNIELHDIGHPRPVVIYRSLLRADSCEIIAARLIELFGSPTFERDGRPPRQFTTSRILPFSEIMDLAPLQSVVDVMGGEPSTIRRNSQGPRGRQGWHTDFVPWAVVANLSSPDGAIQFKTGARSIEEARSRDLKPDIQITVRQGDVVAIGCGDERYHRGLNTSALPREQLVFH